MIKKGSKITLTTDCEDKGLVKGMVGIVKAIRDIKASDYDVKIVKENGIQMALGLVAVVQFKKDWSLVPVKYLNLV